MISASEGTDKYPDPYAVCFGGKFTITDFSDHPAVLQVWHGEPLDFLGPAYKGLVSTAAGRYQITKPTWLGAQMVLRLPNFGPASQDATAQLLIKERGALDAVNKGLIPLAIARCSTEWASLPGSAAGQPQRHIDELLAWYQNAGGALA